MIHNDPHVQEGICTCEFEATSARELLGMAPADTVRYSLRCGLSSHRVKAAAGREIESWKR